MSLSDREATLLGLLSTSEVVSVEELAKKLFVSLPTIRRDLNTLAERGLLLRTHGGATLPLAKADSRIPIYLRQDLNGNAKRQIALNAVKLIKNGDIIFLDASTTVSFLIPLLSDFKDIIVITSGVKSSAMLSETGIKTFCTGGLLLNNSFSYIGQDAVNMIRHYNADLVFFSCHGISSSGMLTDNSHEENDLRQEMITRSKRSVLMIDDSKFGTECYHNLCHLSEIDYCFSNLPLPEEYGKPKFSAENPPEDGNI